MVAISKVKVKKKKKPIEILLKPIVTETYLILEYKK